MIEQTRCSTRIHNSDKRYNQYIEFGSGTGDANIVSPQTRSKDDLLANSQSSDT